MMQCRLRDPQRRYNLVYTHVGTIPQSSQCNLDLFLMLNDLSLLAARHCNDSGAIGRGIRVSEIDRRTIKAHVPLRHLRPYPYHFVALDGSGLGIDPVALLDGSLSDVPQLMFELASLARQFGQAAWNFLMCLGWDIVTNCLGY